MPDVSENQRKTATRKARREEERTTQTTPPPEDSVGAPTALGRVESLLEGGASRPPHPLRLPLFGEGRRAGRGQRPLGGWPGPRVGASAPAWCLTGSGGADATRCCAPRSAGAGSASTSCAPSSRFSTASSTANPARTGTPGAGNGTTGSRASARFRSTTSIGVAGGGAALSAGGRGGPPLREGSAGRATLRPAAHPVLPDVGASTPPRSFSPGRGANSSGRAASARTTAPRQAVGCGDGPGPRRPPGVLGGVAGQHERCEHPGAGGGRLEEASGCSGCAWWRTRG